MTELLCFCCVSVSGDSDVAVLFVGNSKVYEVLGRPSTLWVTLSESGLGLTGAFFFPVLSVLWALTHCELLGRVIRKLNMHSSFLENLWSHRASSVAGGAQSVSFQS